MDGLLVGFGTFRSSPALRTGAGSRRSQDGLPPRAKHEHVPHNHIESNDYDEAQLNTNTLGNERELQLRRCRSTGTPGRKPGTVGWTVARRICRCETGNHEGSRVAPSLRRRALRDGIRACGDKRGPEGGAVPGSLWGWRVGDHIRGDVRAVEEGDSSLVDAPQSDGFARRRDRKGVGDASCVTDISIKTAPFGAR